MGNDGGSIPTRRELVKAAARTPTVSEVKATALESLTHAWTHCVLTGESLDYASSAGAIVSDWAGRLYSYEGVLSTLAGARNCCDQERAPADGPTSLRDVVKLHFKRVEDPTTTIACPITLKKLGPSFKAVYLVPCGHVFAESAIRQLVSAGPTSQEPCPECSALFEFQHIIPLLPTDKAELEKLTVRMADLRRKGLTHSLKKDKKAEKNKKRKPAVVAAKGDQGDGEGKKKPNKSTKDKEKHGNIIAAGTPIINNPMAASMTARVMAEQDERQKRRRLAAR